MVTANGGPDRFALTFLERSGEEWKTRQLSLGASGDHWKSAFMGLAFDSEDTLYVSKGESGRVRLFNGLSGEKIASFDLNTDGFHDSYSGDLVLDRERGLLYIVEQANFRVAVFDTRGKRALASVGVGRLPFAIALSPVIKFIRTGLAFGPNSLGGSAPAGIATAGSQVFVSNSTNDSVSIIDAQSLNITADIPIRIPGLDNLRGVLPVGLTYDAASDRLLVAEAGINVIGIIDFKGRRHGEIYRSDVRF